MNRPIRYAEYDNLGQVVATEMYDGDAVSITTDGNTDGVPDRPSSSALRAKTTAAFDELGRVYRAKTFSVDPSSGSVSSNALDDEHLVRRPRAGDQDECARRAGDQDDLRRGSGGRPAST